MNSIFDHLWQVLRRRGGLRLWILAAASLTGIFFFIVVADEVRESLKGDPETAHLLDLEILRFAARYRTPALTQIMTDLTALGSISVTALIAFILFVVLRRIGDITGMWHLAVVLAGNLFWSRALKWIINRPRPGIVPHLATVFDPSFPSGHALNAAALYLTIAFFAARYRPGSFNNVLFVMLAWLVILLVGASRIYLGVHYPSDVFAGFCAGGAWSLIVAALFLRRYRNPGNRR